MKLKEFVIEDKRLKLLSGETNLFAVCEPAYIDTSKAVLFDGHPLVAETQFSEIVSSARDKVSAMKLQAKPSNFFEVAGFINHVHIDAAKSIDLVLCKVLDENNEDQLLSIIAGGPNNQEAYICLGYFRDEDSIVNLYSLNGNGQLRSSKDGIEILNANQDFEFKFDVDDEYQLSEPKF